MDLECFGNQVRALRIQKGISQEALAECSSLSPSFISRIERGLVSVSIETLTRLAAALDTTADRLLTGIQLDPAVFYAEAHALLKDCSPEERRVILAVVKTLKRCLRKQCA